MRGHRAARRACPNGRFDAMKWAPIAAGGYKYGHSEQTTLFWAEHEFKRHGIRLGIRVVRDRWLLGKIGRPEQQRLHL